MIDPAIRSVVIPVAAGVGNAIMAEPMVRQLAAALGPDARITVVARTHAIGEPLRRTMGVTDVRITGDGARGFTNYVRFARQARPDLYLIPFPSNRWQYNFLATLSGAQRVLIHDYPVGYWRALHFLPAERVHAQPGWHDVRQNLNLLKPLGIEPDHAMNPRFELNEVDHDAANALLREHGADLENPFIAVHAGSGKTVFGEAKRWPVEKYAQLIDVLAERAGRNFVIVEGPDEAGIAAEVLGHVTTSGANGRIVALPLRGNLGVGGAVLARASVYVGSDSALAHLAAAVGTRAVTVFGPIDPRTVHPSGNADLVVALNKPCAPCFTYPFKTPYPSVRCSPPWCIAEVAVDSVAATVERALGVARSCAGDDCVPGAGACHGA
ncbi:MAG TPA: glycosyltransferase family 9 protein [Tepidisphaeraceae bacterium]|nr:glycosyltransferase family 9 protein [Tepidisphaeraceae bacterium]